MRGALSRQLSDMRKSKETEIKSNHVENCKLVHVVTGDKRGSVVSKYGAGSISRSTDKQDESGIIMGSDELQKGSSGITGSRNFQFGTESVSVSEVVQDRAGQTKESGEIGYIRVSEEVTNGIGEIYESKGGLCSKEIIGKPDGPSYHNRDLGGSQMVHAEIDGITTPEQAQYGSEYVWGPDSEKVKYGIQDVRQSGEVKCWIGDQLGSEKVQSLYGTGEIMELEEVQYRRENITSSEGIQIGTEDLGAEENVQFATVDMLSENIQYGTGDIRELIMVHNRAEELGKSKEVQNAKVDADGSEEVTCETEDIRVSEKAQYRSGDIRGSEEAQRTENILGPKLVQSGSEGSTESGYVKYKKGKNKGSGEVQFDGSDILGSEKIQRPENVQCQTEDKRRAERTEFKIGDEKGMQDGIGATVDEGDIQNRTGDIRGAKEEQLQRSGFIGSKKEDRGGSGEEHFGAGSIGEVEEVQYETGVMKESEKVLSYTENITSRKCIEVQIQAKGIIESKKTQGSEYGQHRTENQRGAEDTQSDIKDNNRMQNGIGNTEGSMKVQLQRGNIIGSEKEDRSGSKEVQLEAGDIWEAERIQYGTGGIRVQCSKGDSTASHELQNDSGDSRCTEQAQYGTKDITGQDEIQYDASKIMKSERVKYGAGDIMGIEEVQFRAGNTEGAEMKQYEKDGIREFQKMEYEIQDNKILEDIQFEREEVLGVQECRIGDMTRTEKVFDEAGDREKDETHSWSNKIS